MEKGPRGGRQCQGKNLQKVGLALWESENTEEVENIDKFGEEWKVS